MLVLAIDLLVMVGSVSLVTGLGIGVVGPRLVWSVLRELLLILLGLGVLPLVGEVMELKLMGHRKLLALKTLSGMVMNASLVSCLNIGI